MGDKKTERDERLANALRENLKRRKAGARGKDKIVNPAQTGTPGRENAGD